MNDWTVYHLLIYIVLPAVGYAIGATFLIKKIDQEKKKCGGIVILIKQSMCKIKFVNNLSTKIEDRNLFKKLQLPSADYDCDKN